MQSLRRLMRIHNLLRICGLVTLVWLFLATTGHAAEEPILRVEADGPTSSVTSLAFSPDGNRLYTGGLDKLIRVWDKNVQTGRFELRPDATFRVPIGPGDEGFIYCIAVSPNGKWLAVGGRGAHRASPGFRRGGFLTPREAVSDAVRADDGQIYLFDTATGEARILRGHLGPVLALAFSEAANPSLYSLGRTEVYHRDRGEWRATVRQFDVASGRYVAGKVLPEPRDLRPGLAVLSRPASRSAGDRALLAWGDGNLRVWDVAANQLDQQGVSGEGQLNSTVVVDDRRGRVITGSFVPQDGASRLQVWEAVPGRPYLRTLTGPLSLTPTGNVIHHPQAIALLSGQGGGRGEVLAVLLQNVQAPSTTVGWELRLYDYGDSGVGRERSRVALADFGRSTAAPALAASAGGQVALAVGSDDVVLVFDAAELMRMPNAQPQRLSCSALSLRSAAFVRQGQSRGVLVRDEGENACVYDFSARRVVTDQDWATDTARDENWTVSVERDQQNQRPREQVVLTSRAGGRQPIRITMPEGHQVTASRLVVPARRDGEAAGGPVVVVASDVSLSPTLAVYDVASRSLLRQYTGHTATVRSIEASADGRLLITAGDDHTLRVFSLLDLAGGPNAQGGLPGLTVEARDGGRLEVTHVAPVGPAVGRLQPGDRIVAVRDANGRVQPKDVKELFDFIEGHRAGESIVFELATRGAVEVRLTPAADERKPLFTMFFQRDPDGGLHWVGWSPLGPFDASDARIERELGWHFNAPGEARPVRFARLEEYPEFRREGVLGEMLASAEPPRIARAQLPAPALELSVAELAGGDSATMGEYVLQSRTATAKLAVVGLTPRDIRRIEVRVDGEPVGQMQRTADQNWTLAIDNVDWRRGVHHLEAVLVTDEPEPQRCTQGLSLRYQPPPPAIELTSPQETHVAEPQVRVAANVAPAAGQPCAVRLIHWHNGRQVPASAREWTITAAQPIDQTVELREGMNEIELRAVNADALPGFEHVESANALFVVSFTPAAPPRIAVAVEVPDDMAAEPRRIPFRIGGRVEIDRPEPTLHLQFAGGTAAPQGTLNITRTSTSTEDALQLKLPQEGQPVSQPLDLREPGEYVLSLAADAAEGAIEVFRGTLVLTAPLPTLEIVRPDAEATLVAGRDNPVALVEAQIDRQGIAYPFEVSILRNGIPLDVVPTIREDVLLASVPVEPGTNYLQVLLDNGFSRSATSPVAVKLLQLPEVERVEATIQRAPLCDLAIAGRSAGPLQSLRINGQSYPAEDLEITTTGDQWETVIADFPLQAGNNTIEVVAYNLDGASRDPQTIQVLYQEPAAPAKPVIRVLQPTTVGTVSRPSADVEFTIATSTPLRRYEIYNNDVKITESAAVAPIATDPQGRTVHAIQEQVRVFRGVNNVRVVAVTEGGAEEVVLPPVSYIEPPIRFRVTGIELVSAPGKMIQPKVAADGTISFAQAASDNLVYIHGKVSWSGESERPTGVMAFVNEFQWPAVALRDTRPGEAEFRIPALLNQATNEVTLASAYEKDAAEQATFAVQCSKPAERTWLHLLVVGVGVPREQSQDLMNRARQSLGIDADAGDERRPDGFDEVFYYGPLVGSSLGSKDIFRELMQIDAELQTRGPGGNRACDVVMLYYEGGDIVMTDRGAGISTRPVGEREGHQLVEHTLTVAFLEDFVRRLHGAQVMLLDLARNPSVPMEADLPTWNNKTRTAVFRYVWLRKRDATAEGSSLLSVLEQISPLVRLADLDAALSRIASGQSGVLEYDRHLPDDMATLSLGP